MEGGACGSSQPVWKRVRPLPNCTDRTVYEWEQSLEEVNMYIAPPPGITAHALDIKIDVTHLRIGIKGNPPFLDVRGPCDRAWRLAALLSAPVFDSRHLTNAVVVVRVVSKTWRQTSSLGRATGCLVSC